MPIKVEFGPPPVNYDNIAEGLDKPQKKRVRGEDLPTFNFGRLYSYTSKNEGTKNKVYKDTEGVPTIGTGFNLTKQDARGRIEAVGANYDDVLSGKAELTPEQSKKLANQDMRTAVESARRLAPSFDTLTEDRQIALADMAFTLGATRLGEFDKMLKAIEANDWVTAQAEIRNSIYYSQVGQRAERNIALFGTDEVTNAVDQSVPNVEPEIDYDAIADDLDVDRAKFMRGAVSEKNPDEQAEIDALTTLTGLPRPVV